MRPRFLEHVTQLTVGAHLSDFWIPPQNTYSNLLTTITPSSLYGGFDRMIRYRLNFQCGASYCISEGAERQERERVRETAERALCREIYGDLQTPLRAALVAAMDGDRAAIVKKLEGILQFINGEDVT